MKKTKIYSWVLFVIGFALTACSNLDDSSSFIPQKIDGTIIYSEPFSSSLGDFKAKSVLGTENWSFNSNGYALMTGYVSSTNKADEAWLISPVIDLKDVSTAHFTFDHVARYFGNASVDATIWVSENYNSNDSVPAYATWVQLNNKPFIDPGTWPAPLPTSEQISLTSFAGKKIRIAFKYQSTTAKAGTWELKNFMVKSGEAVNLAGNTGLSSAPYKVFEALTVKGLSKYVTGYVVGYTRNSLNYYAADTCTQITNVLIADTTTNVYSSRCMVVQLPTGIVRDSLNLYNNRKLFGKKITVYGLLGTSAYGLSEMANTSYFILPNTNTGGVKPIEPIFAESFQTSLGQFTSVKASGVEAWTWNSYKYAMVTGYVNSVNKADESWLISPLIDLTGFATPKMSFMHVVRYCGNAATEATVWVSEDYISGMPSTGTWTQIPTAFVNASNWTLVSSGEISLAAYSNKKIKVAFKYISTTTKAGTWELNNFQVLK